MTDTDRQFAHWSRYWAGGALTSLPEDFRENYDGELAQFWSARFAALPDQARLLDVCTGNGAVALLAARWAVENQRRDIEIVAVDAARVDPAVIARQWPGLAELLPMIAFQPETPLETLDVPAASVDLVCSQYGLEYCDLALAVPRLGQALKPGGELVMLAHDLSTDMVATMEAELADHAVLESLGFARLLKRWSGGLLDAQALRGGLLATFRQLSTPGGAAGGQLLGQVSQSCQALLAMSPGQLLAQKAQAAAYLEQIEAGRMRAEDMLRVNRQIGQDDAWLSLFDEAGLELLEVQPVRYRGQHHVGTARRWRKR